MKIVGWKAWYTEGRVFHSNEKGWAALPGKGVLAVMVFFDEPKPDGYAKREILLGSRRYFRAQGTEQEFIKQSLHTEEWILKHYKTTPGDIKEGLWDDNATIRRVQEEANKAEWRL